MRDIAPDLEEFWFETYGRIARTGESIRFENRAEALGRWFDVYAMRLGEPERCQVAVLFTDITARKELEKERAILAAREHQIAEQLQDALQPKIAPVPGKSSGITASPVRIAGFRTCFASPCVLSPSLPWLSLP